ncbi:hypothetical protein GCM10023142_30060 [Anaerocolumna aminovalerica]|uniref:Uncharacterized protein n=1 Tax=Anaerocolumna aminovalerica TaxID=1527 RepID=A0A1I5J028_9FIRM|nr:hypothetical protein [Anaerocolumna aminovalerica]SFO65731.1 hypothetical protein SAMN04489757_1587 [Anaerocolumna aminovalerica]
MQMELANDLVVQCEECGTVHVIHKDSLDLNVSSYERNMGDEIEYHFEGECRCDECGNYLRYVVRGYEYPVDTLNYEDRECCGGHFVQPPELAVDYYEFEYDSCDKEKIYSDVNKRALISIGFYIIKRNCTILHHGSLRSL